MSVRRVLAVLGVVLVVAGQTVAHTGSLGRSSKSTVFELLYAPFAFLPNGSGPWLASALGLGLVLVALCYPREIGKNHQARVVRPNRLFDLDTHRQGAAKRAGGPFACGPGYPADSADKSR